MAKASTCLILFDQPHFGLDQAQAALQKRGLTVTRQGDVLAVHWGNGPTLRIGLARGQHVREAISKLASGTPYAATLKTYAARLEIRFDDLDEVLDEINTLIDVQATLQDATHGYQYNTWNRRWAAPDE